jgi:hypothetical protein
LNMVAQDGRDKPNLGGVSFSCLQRS